MTEGETTKLLYRAPDSTEAALILQALDSEGIPTRSTAGLAAIGFGELGADALQVDIRVPERFLERGRQVIEELQARSRQQRDRGGGWSCPNCQEHNAETFEVCWNCGATGPPSSSMG